MKNRQNILVFKAAIQIAHKRVNNHLASVIVKKMQIQNHTELLPHFIHEEWSILKMLESTNVVEGVKKKEFLYTVCRISHYMTSYYVTELDTMAWNNLIHDSVYSWINF